jgi:hypothetical protein
LEAASSAFIPIFLINHLNEPGRGYAQKGYGPSGTLDGSDVGAVRKWGTGGPGYSIKAEFNPRKHEFGETTR